MLFTTALFKLAPARVAARAAAPGPAAWPPAPLDAGGEWDEGRRAHSGEMQVRARGAVSGRCGAPRLPRSAEGLALPRKGTHALRPA